MEPTVKRVRPSCPLAKLYCWLTQYHDVYIGENSRPVFSNRTLSLRPKRNSGIPERKTRILMEPTISLRRTLPLALTWKIKGFQWSVEKLVRLSLSNDNRPQKIEQDLWRTKRGSLQTLWLAFLKQHSDSKTSSSYQEVDWLNDVQEDLVLPVLDALWPPGDSVGDCGRGSGGTSVQLVALLGYVSERHKCKQWGETQENKWKWTVTAVVGSQKASKNSESWLLRKDCQASCCTWGNPELTRYTFPSATVQKV